MAEVKKKFSELDPGSVPFEGTETIAAVQGGITKRATISGMHGAGWWDKLKAAFVDFVAPEALHANDADTATYATSAGYAPTPATATNNTQIATTAFVKNQGYAPLASPSITGSCTTNGTTDNTLVLAGIVSALALETGDVIQITGSTDALNDKLFTVESITNNDLIIVNYEHAGNRGNGSLKLADETATVTIKRIAKWYNAPLGLGQAWIKLTTKRARDTVYTGAPNRTIKVHVMAGGSERQTLKVNGVDVAASRQGSDNDPTLPAEVGSSLTYQFVAASNELELWSELR